MRKPGARWQHNIKKDKVQVAVAAFLHRFHKGKDVALWSKEGVYLGHFTWSRMMHFPIAKSTSSGEFQMVVI